MSNRFAIHSRTNTVEQTTSNQIRELREPSLRRDSLIDADLSDGMSGAKGRQTQNVMPPTWWSVWPWFRYEIEPSTQLRWRVRRSQGGHISCDCDWDFVTVLFMRLGVPNQRVSITSWQHRTSGSPRCITGNSAYPDTTLKWNVKTHVSVCFGHVLIRQLLMLKLKS